MLARFITALCACTAIVLLPACSVVESQPIDLEAPPSFQDAPCQSRLGSYSLPKAFLRIRIGQKKDGSAPDIAAAANAPPVQVVRHPDPHLFFCLDHYNNPNSDDRISVVRWPSDQPGVPKASFLGAVLVNVTDQSSYIVRALIRALFISVTRDSNFAPRSATFDPSEIVGDFEFDPFNQREAATINAQLRRFGFCVVMEEFMFQAVRRTVVRRPAAKRGGKAIEVETVDAQDYCDSPLAYSIDTSPVFKAYQKLDEMRADPQLPGLLYRPTEPYRLFIYRKPDPNGHAAWQLQYSTTVQLENMSPVLSLRVTRAMFAHKTMNFVFQEGVLKTACLSKTSEAAGFVEIPLEIARSIVAVPGAIVKVKIGDVNSETQLVNAQNSLFQMQQVYMQTLQGGSPAVTASNATPTVPKTPDLGPPSDLKPLDTKTVWGSDLFNNALSTVCGGDAS